MEKGKLGVRLCFYGVLAFILALLGYSTLLFLLAGVVLLVEKDEWTTRQVIQAFCLCIASSLVYNVLHALDFINNIPFVGTAWSTIVGIINGVIGLIIFALCIVGMLNNTKGKDANIPLAGKFADWAFGIITQKVAPQPAQTYQQAPNQNAAPGQNFTQQAPANGQFYQTPQQNQPYTQAPTEMPQQGGTTPAQPTDGNQQ